MAPRSARLPRDSQPGPLLSGQGGDMARRQVLRDSLALASLCRFTGARQAPSLQNLLSQSLS